MNGVVTAFTFYLGVHQPGWLARTDAPLFVSRNALRRYKVFPRTLGPWALDSGAFTELSRMGRWTTTPTDYAAFVRRCHDDIDRMAFCAPQDWMCEPIVIHGGKAGTETFVGTGLSVREHQKRTTANYLDLCRIAPEMPWMPVLQGWYYDDYLRHVEDYAEAGVSLTACPVVGLGSVCRRQHTGMAEDLIRELCGMGIRLHAFGFKILGLPRTVRYLASSDSMAWSLQARRAGRQDGCTHRNCANCLRYALAWRQRVLDVVRVSLAGMEQRTFFGA